MQVTCIEISLITALRSEFPLIASADMCKDVEISWTWVRNIYDAEVPICFQGLAFCTLAIHFTEVKVLLRSVWENKVSFAYILHYNKCSRCKSLSLKLLAKTSIDRNLQIISGSSCYLKAWGLMLLVFYQCLLALQCYFHGGSLPITEDGGCTSSVLQTILSFDICAYK